MKVTLGIGAWVGSLQQSLRTGWLAAQELVEHANAELNEMLLVKVAAHFDQRQEHALVVTDNKARTLYCLVVVHGAGREAPVIRLGD